MKKLLFVLLLFITLIPLPIKAAGVVSSEMANKISSQWGDQGLNASKTFESTPVETTVANIIQAFLSLLGMIFIVLMIYGGYSWMTAQGDESKVEKAKATIQRAVIGLIITVSAYSITYTVFKFLQ